MLMTFGELWLRLLGSVCGELRLKIPNFEPEIMLSNMVHVVYVGHAEWCALNSPCMRVYVRSR